MDSLRVKRGKCPLGHTCETLKEDGEGPYREVCPWFEEFALRGEDGSVEKVTGECSIKWNAIFLAQQGEQLLGIQQATESGRNRMTDLVSIAENNQKAPMIEYREVKQIEEN